MNDKKNDTPNKPNPDNDYASKTWDVLASAGIFSGTGIPVPPSVIKSLRKAADKFLIGATEFGMTYVDEATAKRKSINAGKQLVLDSAAKEVAKRVTSNDVLVERAFDVFAADLMGKQRNKEKVLEFAVAEINSTKSFHTSEEVIDEDWLSSFATLASAKSNSDVQQLLGKILAGEIRSPGSFSPLTLHILSTLTRDVARKFESFCNLTAIFDIEEKTPAAFFIHAAYPGFLQKGPPPEYGISYGDLLTLQNYGLLTQNLNAGVTPNTQYLEKDIEIGGTRLRLTSKTGIPISLTINGISPLSISGSELRTIISLNTPPSHLTVQINYLNSLGFNVATQ